MDADANADANVDAGGSTIAFFRRAKKDWIKRLRSKATEKGWRHQFPHYKSMGSFCCHGNQSFDPICPKTLCSLSPTPMMLCINLIKIGQLASEIFKLKVWIFCHIRASNSQNEWSDSAQNLTRLTCYACTGYQQLWWWFDQKWMS